MSENLKDLLSKAASSMSKSAATPALRATASGATGVRMKKSQTLLGAIAGVFLGIGLVLGSPVVLWYAESQHTAKDFQSATPVEASSATDGYVSFTGAPEVAAPFACVEGAQSCLYYLEQNQELETITEEQCGTVSEDARVIQKTVMECDEDGNCEQCYQVERDVWETKTEDEKFGTAVVGSYTVNFSSEAVMLGLESTTIDHTATTRDVWTTFPVPDQLTVAGDANGGQISTAQSTYVLSPYDSAKTLSELESRDSSRAWMLRIVTLAMLFIGFCSIFGPISYFSHLLRKLPLVGPFIKEATGLVVGIVSLLLAVVTFALIWVLVMFIKNIVVLLIVLAVLGGGFMLYLKNKKEPAKV